MPWAEPVGALRELLDGGTVRAAGILRSSLDGPSGPTSVGTAFHRVAAERGVSPQQIALAWLPARSPNVIPVPGASRPASIPGYVQ